VLLLQVYPGDYAMPDLPLEPDPEGLVFRSKDDGPGLHVLLVGVSAYTYLNDGDHQCADTRGLGQIDCAARTAYEIFNWLARPRPELQLRHPLRTCRLLASPSPAELQTAPQLAHALPATFDNLEKAVLAWRKDAATDRAGATLFYFAGHGVQRTRGDSLLLLSEFLAPGATLKHSVDLSCIYDGMGEPDFPDMAQTQYYFVDACRTDLPGVQELADRSAPALWDVTLGGSDERVAPIFHGAGSGQLAYGSTVPGGVSAFGTDLLASLNGGGAERVRCADGTSRWEVTIGTLARSLPLLVRDANEARARKLRSFGVDKWTDMDATITVLSDAPTVDCMLQIWPNGAESCASIDLTLGAAPCRLAPPLKNPHPFQVKAGGYVLRASVPPDAMPAYAAIEEVVTVSPPRFTHSVFFQ
jgi:hypothetical protein